MRVQDKINVVVLVNKGECDKYSKLFKFLLGERVVEARYSPTQARLVGEEFAIHIHVGGYNNRGLKGHYVLNLVQDKDLNQMVAMSIPMFFNEIKKDPRWNKLL